MKALYLKALRIIDETEHYFNRFQDGGSFLETRVYWSIFCALALALALTIVGFVQKS